MSTAAKPIEHKRGDKVKVAWPDGSVEDVEYVAPVNDYQVMVRRVTAALLDDDHLIHVRKRWLFR